MTDTPIVISNLGSVYECTYPMPGLIGIDVVKALEFLRQYPQYASQPYYDCIRPQIEIMQAHMQQKHGVQAGDRR